MADAPDPAPPAGLPDPEGRRFRVDFGLVFIAGLGIAAGIGVWISQGPARFFDLLWGDMTMILALLPKIFGGILLAIALAMILPRDRVLRLVGPDSGLRGLVIATGAGAVVPGGPQVTYPLATGLMRAGADAGAGTAMVSGWVLLGVNRVLIWELSFLPGWLVALRLALTLWVPVAVGFLARAWARRAPPAEPDTGIPDTGMPDGRQPQTGGHDR